MNPPMNISADRATTLFCSERFSLLLRRLASSSGDLMYIMMPMRSIGMKSIAMSSHALLQRSVPAERNISAPMRVMPARYLVKADISSFILFLTEVQIFVDWFTN